MCNLSCHIMWLRRRKVCDLDHRGFGRARVNTGVTSWRWIERARSTLRVILER